MEVFSGRDDMFWNKGSHSIKAGGEYLARNSITATSRSTCAAW